MQVMMKKYPNGYCEINSTKGTLMMD